MADKVQLIKEEIEFYKESMKGLEPNSDFRRGQITAYNQIMQFIDSLQEEHNEDLDFQTFAKEMCAVFALPSSETQNTEENPLNWEYAIARHFTEWQKQQMMKDAVEAEVFTDYNINFGYGSLTANIDLDEQHLKEGDKVKIIIVKTEQP